MISLEEKTIEISNLPGKWQSDENLDALEVFLSENWKMRSLLYNDGKNESSQQFLSFGRHSIRTNQYIGTIIFNGERLDVLPKVFHDTNHSNSEALVDLMYSNIATWISYCEKTSYPFLNMSVSFQDGSDKLKELLVSLYIRYVQYTIDRNLYYQYEERTEDLGVIRGHFNIADYIKNKLPSARNNVFSCTYSEFESNNAINRIIKYVLKSLINETSIPNKKLIRVILQKLTQVDDVVCHPSDCDKIHIPQNKGIYKTILTLSKMFLLEKINLGENHLFNKVESFCFLFPADLLFEGFVGGVIKETIGKASGYSVKTQSQEEHVINSLFYENDTSLGSLFGLRYDIKIKGNDQIILDTKYKLISRFEGNNINIKTNLASQISQSDLYQICTYARKQGVHDVCLVYPMTKDEDKELLFPYGICKDCDTEIRVWFVRIPFVIDERGLAFVCEAIKQFVEPLLQ